MQGYLRIEMADKPEKNGHDAAPAEEKRKGKGGSKGGQKPEKPPAEKKSTGGRRKKSSDKWHRPTTGFEHTSTVWTCLFQLLLAAYIILICT